MNTRDLLLQTADFLEQNPDRYSFMENLVPGENSLKGCVIGWMACFAGIKKGESASSYSTEKLMGITFDAFCNRMHALSTSEYWVTNAGGAAAVLRKYADKYYSVPEDLPLPVWAIMRDREYDRDLSYRKFRDALVLTPRTILPADVSEDSIPSLR